MANAGGKLRTPVRENMRSSRNNPIKKPTTSGNTQSSLLEWVKLKNDVKTDVTKSEQIAIKENIDSNTTVTLKREYDIDGSEKITDKKIDNGNNKNKNEKKSENNEKKIKLDEENNENKNEDEENENKVGIVFKNTEEKNTELKKTKEENIDLKNIEKKNVEPKKIEKKTTEFKNIEEKNTELKHNEATNTELKNTDEENTELKNTAEKNTEEKNTEEENTEEEKTEKEKTEKEKTEVKTTEEEKTEVKNTELKNTEEENPEAKNTEENNPANENENKVDDNVAKKNAEIQEDNKNKDGKMNGSTAEKPKFFSFVKEIPIVDDAPPIITIDNLEYHISPTWRAHLKSEFTKEYFVNIKKFLRTSPRFFPPLEKIFTFSHHFKVTAVKVVIIGQDPYHNERQAMGLSFSVPATVRPPPSLINIYKEIETDVGVIKDKNNGDLTPWAQQGVLLLNDVLTVTKNQPRSHGGKGWETFTTRILEIINKSCSNVVFMLWGRHAQTKAAFIDKKKHLVLVSAHPSPFSVQNFFGCKHFSKANDYLKKHGKKPISW